MSSSSKTHKFSKNIFTEVINNNEDKTISQNNVNSNSINNNSEALKPGQEEHKGENSNHSDHKNTDKTSEASINTITNSSLKNLKRNNQLISIISEDYINWNDLTSFSWSGIPFDIPKNRSECWKYLLGFYPLNNAWKETTVHRKKEEYSDICRNYSSVWSNPDNWMNDQEWKTYRQILKDVPRTMPEFQMFQSEKIKFMMTRVWYVWSMRHPASGYVQGFNDLCTPFFVVFFWEYFPNNTTIDEVWNINMESSKLINEKDFFNIEMNIYFSLTKLWDRIQTNYTHNQPGIAKMIKRMEFIVEAVDKEWYEYLKKMEIDYIQFCFRWMNCFLMREFSINLIIRWWDTYFSEENGFSDFHWYVCACLLLNFSEKLKQMNEFQEWIMFLQKLPTDNWSVEDMNILLAKSYQIREMYSGWIKDRKMD